jgi:hypothetical protein
MPHEVFISHASLDKPVADAVCAALENTAIRCWIAPRDVQPGRSFAGEITRAIQHSKVMVLIFSAHSNTSEQILREVQLAANSHLHIVQFRIEDVIPNDDLEYYLSIPHWLDALTPPLEANLQRLQTSVRALLEMASEDPAKRVLTPVAPSVDSRAERTQQDSIAIVKDPTTPLRETGATHVQPPIPPIGSISAIAALNQLKVWTSERRILVSGVMLFLLALAGFLMWLGHQKTARQGNQPAIATPERVIANPERVIANPERVIANPDRVIANPKGLSKPAEPNQRDPTTRRMGQIEEGIRLQGYNLNPNPILVKSADECSKQCEQTDSCLAMTFVKHPNQSGRGDCWLKSAVPPRSSAPLNFASAVKN